jgi:CO dehydrogenase maturation factor
MARNLLEIQDVALKVAVSGQGGVARSALAGALAHLHATDHLKALAIDADPDVNSASALGLAAELRASVHTIAEDRKLIEARRGAKVREFAQIFKLDCKEQGIMLAVHKPGERSVETAQRIRKRSANLGIRRFAMVLSR